MEIRDYIWGVKPLNRPSAEVFFLSGFNNEYLLNRYVRKKKEIFENLLLRDSICINYIVADARKINGAGTL